MPIRVLRFARLLNYTALLSLMAGVCRVGMAQEYDLDSLLRVLPTLEKDTSHILTLTRLTHRLAFSDQNEAVEYGQRALALSQEMGYAKGQVHALTYMAEAHWVQGQHNEAQAMLEEARALLPTQADHAVKGVILNYLGRIAFYRKDPEGAKKYFRESMYANLAANNQYDLAFSYQNLATAHMLKTQNLDSATLYYAKAREVATATGNKEVQALVLANYGYTYLLRSMWQEAITYYQHAQAEFEARQDFSRLAMAMVYETRAHLGLKDIERSQEILEACRPYLPLTKDPYVHTEYLTAWRNLHELEGDYAKALAFQKKITQANDSLFALEKRAHIERLSSQFEAERVEAENQLLREQGTRVRKELALNRSLLGLVSLALLTVVAITVLLRVRRQRQLTAGHLKKVKAEVEQLRKENKQLKQVLKSFDSKKW